MTLPLSRVFLVGALMIAGASESAAAQRECDPSLTPPAGTAYGYQRRSDRCEGLYTRRLSAGTELVVVGLMVRSADIEFRAINSVTLRWRPTAGQDIRIEAQSLRWRTHFQMDVVRPGAESAYRWPTSLLGPLGLRRSEVAVLAWIQSVGNNSDRIHLPLRMDTGSPSRAVASYEVMIVPGTDFAVVHATLRRLAADGNLTNVGGTDLELGRGSYPARRPFLVTIPLQGILTPGEYVLELNGRRASGGWTTTIFRFRHGPETL
jgi:hypothetical protein